MSGPGSRRELQADVMGAGKASSPPHTLASALSPPGHACFIPLPVDRVSAGPHSHHGPWWGLGAAVGPGWGEGALTQCGPSGRAPALCKRSDVRGTLKASSATGLITCGQKESSDWGFSSLAVWVGEGSRRKR